MVFKRNNYPLDNAKAQTALGDAFLMLAESSEDIIENCGNALTAYKAALEIYNQETYPNDFYYITAKLNKIVNLLFHQIKFQGNEYIP
jgi:hypothetical protein